MMIKEQLLMFVSELYNLIKLECKRPFDELIENVDHFICFHELREKFNRPSNDTFLHTPF